MKPESYLPTQPALAQPADTADASASALWAVQVALDRRDNGGDTHPASEQER
ncbi:MAG TPA: hypothetical protein VN840_00640 [Streptosporangiaceae bacterium]|nr:hypothetical protein [Streptosporangiaceae bacterium]